MQKDLENLAVNLIKSLEGKDETLNVLVANLERTTTYMKGIKIVLLMLKISSDIHVSYDLYFEYSMHLMLIS